MRRGRAELRQAADELAWKYDRGLRLSDEELDALVEASFRLGVHPDTPPAEAIALLRRAHHLDVDNPKHAYHLGRLYLAHERFEQAALWLELAARLAPGSHRVWAHLSVLERWLDLREKGQQGYTGARRERAAHIAADLTSEESRWSGIHDLEAEARLRGDTSGRTRDALTAELELLAGMAAHRTGGAAAFVVLAVQWIVYGYPAATVRRLAAHLDEGAARDLLELVCDLAESDEAELPGALAAALAGGELPGVLVALLHQRRLLRRPLRFPDLGAHAAARGFEGGDPDAVVKALDRATARLTADPPAHLGEAATKQAVQQEAGDPRQRLDDVLTVAERLEQARNGVKALIGKRARQKPSDAETYSLLTGDVETLTEVLGRIESRAEAALAVLRGLKQALPAAEFGQRLQNGENQLTDVIGPLGGVRGTLTKKVGKKCAAVAEQFPGAAPIPSAEALDLLAVLLSWQQPTNVLLPEAVAAPEPTETRETPQPPESPVIFADDPVHAALARADDALRATFDRAAATLDAYTGPALRAGPVAMLRDYVEGTRAEALYRTGRGGQARAVWNQMLARDPLDLALLRNLAVAHTCAGDVAHATAAWRAYLVAHYLLDLAEGAPYGHAVRRAELHELLTRGFGTACLRRKPPGPEEDLDSVPLVLASRAKAVAVATHLRLEALNRIICHPDPAIVLGLDRSAGAEQVRAARERRLAFVERACAELPGSAGPAFASLCAKAVEAAADRGPARSLAGNEELAAHLEWVKGLLLLKVRIREGVYRDDADWPCTEYSGDVIGNLRLLDEVGPDPDDDFVLRAAQQVAPGMEPRLFLRAYGAIADQARDLAAAKVLEHLRTAGDEVLTRQFPLIARSWVRNELPADYLLLLDSPDEVYKEVVSSALRVLAKAAEELDEADRLVVEAAVAAMARWVTRLPGATGPARMLARLHTALGRYPEAGAVLRRARQEAFSEAGRLEVDFAFVRLALDSERFAEAVERLRALAGGGVDDPRVRVWLLEGYARWIPSEPGRAGVADITRDLSPWTDEETVEERRRLVVYAVVQPHNARGGALTALVEELRSIRAADPGNLHALEQEAQALFARAQEIRLQMSQASGQRRRALGAELKEAVRQCREAGTDFVGRSADEAARARIGEILARLR
ncbi:tetratricopeptide repeat protein [Nonomuraea roseola]|uniref:Tetratricopeptide repeat protein n=1 Tax=Nonomuraea roseola TaxID=46179 RepID=A0ABV5QG48_9ACTN